MNAGERAQVNAGEGVAVNAGEWFLRVRTSRARERLPSSVEDAHARVVDVHLRSPDANLALTQGIQAIWHKNARSPEGHHG